jgi:hypothetical protein
MPARIIASATAAASSAADINGVSSKARDSRYAACDPRATIFEGQLHRHLQLSRSSRGALRRMSHRNQHEGLLADGELWELKRKNAALLVVDLEHQILSFEIRDGTAVVVDSNEVVGGDDDATEEDGRLLLRV